jgi:hypothetical protein
MLARRHITNHHQTEIINAPSEAQFADHWFSVILRPDAHAAALS